MNHSFKNEVVNEQYQKFIHSVAGDVHSAYVAWISTLELFDSYVEHVKDVLDNRALLDSK